MKRFYTFFVLIFTPVLLTYGPPVSAEVSNPQIYWTSESDAIHRSSLDGSNVETLITGVQAGYITIDAGKIYWGDRIGIRRSSLDGSNVETLITGVDGWSIALDTAADKIYWGEKLGEIIRADFNGTNIEILNDTRDDGATSIALDVTGAKIYWTASRGKNNNTDKIKCANLDGSNIQTLVSGLLIPLDITLDVEGGKMYWIEEYFELKRANLDGTDIETLNNVLDNEFIEGIALDVTGAKIYWTEYEGGNVQRGGRIMRANLDGTDIETLISEIDSPYSIALNFPAADVSDTASLDRITISEIMVALKGGSLPQWIELYNPSDTHAVSLKGWKLEVVTPRSSLTLTLEEKSIKPQETLLIVSEQGRSSDNLQNEQIYNLSYLPFLRDHVLPTNPDYVLLREEFYMKLSNAAGRLVDEVGNFNTDDGKSTWSLPRSLTEDKARASMIRRHDDGVPRLGTDASGWISAINTKLLTGTTSYYGHPDDIGAPGVKSGGALPVTLSSFRVELTDAGVVLRWVTESELDNAGFNILRSETKDGEFKIVNPQLIQGAGTTSERQTYTWKDTTAKPNVVYYYRIEDISHAGVRKQLATVRMRGYISAAGKLTTRWGDLKRQE